ncbi:MAG: M24 family metallopeptidase [bacterium]|nr:M24 family metallopeptidase [bacterium]
MTQVPVTHITSDAERARRYAALREAMAGAGMDAFVICSRGDEFVRGRVQYVSDIFQWAGRGFVVLPLKGEASFVVDPLWGTGYAMQGRWLNDYRQPDDAGTEIGAILSDHGLATGTIGIVGLADITSVADYNSMKNALPNANWQDATDLFDDVRAIKSQEEIDATIETGNIMRRVFHALEAEIRPGVQEVDVLSEAHRLARQLGCMEGIALMGRAPFSCFGPGTRGVIEKDDVMVIDLEWGGPLGYWVEVRRVYSFKPPNDEQKAFWEMRVESFEACVQAMKAGEDSDTVLDARDRVYDVYGYDARDANSYTAHGIGIDSLEPPWVPGKPRIMEENMMINLHPAVGGFSDAETGARLGGISIADNILVGPDGGTRMVDEADEWIVLDA